VFLTSLVKSEIPLFPELVFSTYHVKDEIYLYREMFL
jgi:hypothetical protein